jgi:hypothetical protein
MWLNNKFQFFKFQIPILKFYRKERKDFTPSSLRFYGLSLKVKLKNAKSKQKFTDYILDKALRTWRKILAHLAVKCQLQYQFQLQKSK